MYLDCSGLYKSTCVQMTNIHTLYQWHTWFWYCTNVRCNCWGKLMKDTQDLSVLSSDFCESILFQSKKFKDANIGLSWGKRKKVCTLCPHYLNLGNFWVFHRNPGGEISWLAPGSPITLPPVFLWFSFDLSVLVAAYAFCLTSIQTVQVWVGES